MKLDNIFPRKTEIPQEYLLTEPIHQKKDLIDGNLLEWEGERQNVDSPVYCRVNDEFENSIGSYPLLGEKESIQVLVYR
jgi:glyceraldehyde-3-phosphate dehydrogenase (NADP+)